MSNVKNKCQINTGLSVESSEQESLQTLLKVRERRCHGAYMMLNGSSFHRLAQETENASLSNVVQ